MCLVLHERLRLQWITTWLPLKIIALTSFAFVSSLNHLSAESALADELV